MYDTIPFHPGGTKLTEEAVKLCNFPEGAEILDVGCGSGETLAFLQETCGFQGTGVDSSKALIEKGKLLYPSLTLQKGEGDFLDFPSFHFDGALLECTLSLLNNQTEALHEIFCVLKKGGKLILSDLYLQDPNPNEVKAAHKRSQDFRTREKQFGDCEKDGPAPPDLSVNGAFVREELEDTLKEIGFRTLHWADKTPELREFLGQIIFDYGSVEEWLKAVTPEGEDSACICNCKTLAHAKLGYFLLVAEKPEE